MKKQQPLVFSFCLSESKETKTNNKIRHFFFSFLFEARYIEKHDMRPGSKYKTVNIEAKSDGSMRQSHFVVQELNTYVKNSFNLNFSYVSSRKYVINVVLGCQTTWFVYDLFKLVFPFYNLSPPKNVFWNSNWWSSTDAGSDILTCTWCFDWSLKHISG